MPETLDDSPAERRSRPRLRVIFVFAGGLAVVPFGLGLLGLSYAVFIRMEGSAYALRMGLLLVGASVAWVAGLGWLYHRVVPPVSRARWHCLNQTLLQRTGRALWSP